MALSRDKSKGRKDKSRFTGMPHSVMKHDDYIGLSGSALRLLLEMAMQYNGKNNGNLHAAWSLMKKRGFNSQTTLNKALNELLGKRMIIKTREGWFANPGKRCALYALSWQPVDDCPGKDLEIGPTITPLRKFSMEFVSDKKSLSKNPLQNVERVDPECGAMLEKMGNASLQKVEPLEDLLQG